jgi:type III secretion protein Q
MEHTQLQRPARASESPPLTVRRFTRAHLALAQRPQLDALGGQMLERASAALALALGRPVQLAGRRLETAARAPTCLARTSAFALVELSALGAPAVLDVGRDLVAALVGELAGAGAEPAPVAGLVPLEQAAAGFLCLAVLAELRSLAETERLWAPRLLGWTASREEASRLLGGGELVAFRGTLELGRVTDRVHLYVPAVPLATSLLRTAEAPASPLGAAMARAELPAVLLAGAARLDRAAATALRPRDVVVLPGLGLAGQHPVGAACLRTASFVLVGELSPKGLTVQAVEQRLPQEEPTMSSAAPPDVPVDVEVELARLRLSLGQLAALRIGTVLPLRVGTGEPVVLRVGDRAVARAELVDVEGELGARVLALFD